MMSFSRFVLLYPLLFLLAGCANYKLNYAPVTKAADRPQPPTEAPNYSVYLIGDSGKGSAKWVSPALTALGEDLQKERERSAVVFLGDNIYPDGLPPKSEAVERAQDEIALDHQLAICKDYPGRVFFIAGNHDWYEYGLAGVRRQDKYLRQASNNQTRILPRPGCGDPVEIELTDTITLLLLDSQWWMEDWSKHPDINDGCAVKSREDFDYFLREAMKGNSRKELLVALHHPLFTNGPHGGKFPALTHLFPLRALNKKLWVPLPVLGSALLGIQATVGSRQDAVHANYRLFREIAMRHAKTVGDVIFASGHEHSLQYWEKEGQHFIVSGSGSKNSPAKDGNGALFAYGHYGYAKLNYYADGQVWVQYFSTPENAEKELVFEWQVKPSRVERGAPPTDDFPDQFSSDQERTVPLSQANFSRGKLGTFFWGEHYRAAYADSVTVPELNLSQQLLTVRKRGGGFQTNSLRLMDVTNFQQYTLRSIDKDASRTVPNELNTDVVRSIVSDNFSASHPLAALAVPTMAKAVGVYHAEPELVYLPQQQHLSTYNPDFSNATYLLEGRPSGSKWQHEPRFGNPEDVLSTYDMIQEVREDNDKEIDPIWTLTARLFDIVIADWDRHDDQWRWAERQRGEQEHYRPIPRDRDQAFANYDGLVFLAVRNASPMARQWRPLTAKVPKPQWAFYNGLLFDQSFLTENSRADWENVVGYIQHELTDEVIEQAFAENWPEPFRSRDAPAIIEVIKARRDNLKDIAARYYEYLARDVDVLGTDQKDLFYVERKDDGRTLVQVFDTN
ncbi:MAG: metallophosphoesterase, partial [Bacteroidota bacterium]